MLIEIKKQEPKNTLSTLFVALRIRAFGITRSKTLHKILFINRFYSTVNSPETQRLFYRIVIFDAFFG